MQALKQTVHVNPNRQAWVHVPYEFGETVEVIVLSVSGDRQPLSFFECVGEDGVDYQLIDWTENDFCSESLMGISQEDDTVAEDIFDV